MTTWTTPQTWATGDLVTAADLNEQLRDNLLYLKGATTFNSVSVDADYTTTTMSWTNIDATNLQLTVVTRGGKLLVGFETAAHSGGSSNAYVCFDVTIDGARLGTVNGLAYANRKPVGSMGVDQYTLINVAYWVPALTPGTHVFRLQWRAFDNVDGMKAYTSYIKSTTNNGAPTRLWVLEVDA